MLLGTRIVKYLALFILALLVGAGVYVAGKTPKIIDAAIAQLVLDLQKKQGIRLQLGTVSVEGFLTVRVDGFVFEKKDIHLFVQAKSIKARLSPLGYWFDGNPVSRLEIDTPEVMAQIDLDIKNSTTESFKPNFALNELIIHQGRADITLNNKVLQIVSLRTNSKITPQLVDVRSLLIQTPEVDFFASGKMRFDNPTYLGLGSDMQLRLSGKLSKVPEIRLLPIALDADINLLGRLRYVTRERGFEFEGHTTMSSIQIDEVSIASLSSLVFLNQQGFELRGAEVGFAGTTCHVNALFRFDEHLKFSGEVDAQGASLYELLSNLDVKNSWVDLKLDTKGFVEGQIKPEFSLKGHAQGKAVNLIVKDPKSIILQTAYPIQFEMDLAADAQAFQFRNAQFKDAKSRFIADCDLFLDDREGMWLEAQFETLDFASVKYQIADESYRGYGESHVAIEGPYEHLRIRAPSQIRNFKFGGFEFGNIIGVFSFEDNQIFVKNIKAKKKSLEYEGNLSVLIEKPLLIEADANLKRGLGEDLIPGVFSGPIQGHLAFKGPLEKGYRDRLRGHLNLSGSMEAIADLTKGDGTLQITRSLLGDADFTFKIKENQLEAQGLFKESKASSEIKIALDSSLPFSAKLWMPYGPLKSLIPQIDWLQTFHVQTGILLKATGDLGQLEDVQAALDLSPTAFYLGTLRFLATEKMVAHYQNRKLSIKPVLFRSVHGDQIELEGILDTDGLDIDARTKMDLWFLTHLDERIEGAYGDFEANLQIKGPWIKPTYLGKGQIASGSYLSLRDYPPGLTDLLGQIDFQGDRASLKLEGKASQGYFALDGFLNLQSQSFERIQVELKQMPVYYSSFLTGTANGFLKLEGPFEEPTLSGDVRFPQLLITKELSPIEFKAPRSRARKKSVKLDVLFHADDNVRVESKSLNAEFKGNLNLVGNTNALGMIGEITVFSGEVYFRNNYYHLMKARASFDNPFRVVPYVDVEANSQILGYDVTVRAQGELSKPELQFSSKPTLSQTDLLSLITFGFTSRDHQDNFGVARTAGLEALSAYSGVGDKVLQLLPDKSIDELRLGTLYNQNGEATPSVVLGMEVFKTMRLRFQSAMLQNTKRLELEKYINKRWRWRLIWNSEGITNYGDAGADLWIRWDY